MRARALIPLGVFLSIAILLGIGLTIDSDEVPSPLVGKPVPDFDVPTVRDAGQRFRPADMEGQVWLLNVWATWCTGCRVEHDVLMSAAREHDVTIVGLDYKDERAAAIDWLDRRGDPYVASPYDPKGKVGMDLGVYGVPETYVIDAEGIIRYKHIGPISPEQLRDDILPRVRELKAS
jgi:cytochrome c biogenesis protein CcmG/thiol:disulfide interchange protein DsbE